VVTVCLALAVLAMAVGGGSGAAAQPAPTAATGIAAPPARAFRSTGFFHVAQVSGRMWLVDPSGRPFYSSGIDHVSASPDTDRVTERCPCCDTVAARYHDVDAWRDAQIKRFRLWGFNTIGAFSDTSPRLVRQMPYTVLLSMASGSDWFAPSFVAHADQVASGLTATRDDPNLIGYFTDSELHWGPDWRSGKPVLDDYLALPAGSPGRKVAEAHRGDPSGFLLALSTRYFSVTSTALRTYDPNHLDLGVKAVAQLIEPELLKGARPYVDVWSVDDYSILPLWEDILVKGWAAYLPDEPGFASIAARIGRPILVGEYSFRAADSGLPNSYPPLFPILATQADRASRYRAYVSQLYRTPSVVGDHWFEMVDEPRHGRFDGEDSNFGILSTKDVPYKTLLRTMVWMHARAPGRHSVPSSACKSWALGHPPDHLVCTAR